MKHVTRRDVHVLVHFIVILSLLLNQILPFFPLLAPSTVGAANEQSSTRDLGTSSIQIASASSNENETPLTASAVSESPNKPVSDPAAIATALRSAPIMFIENVGQFENQVKFQVRGATGAMFAAEDGLWLTFLEKAQNPLPGDKSSVSKAQLQDSTPRKGVNIKLSFNGANPNPRIEPFNRLDTHMSYFIGNDPKNWHADIPVWGGIRYKDIYPGIDVEITSEKGQMVQYVVARNISNLKVVRLQVDGADSLILNTDKLNMETPVGQLTLPLFRVVDSNGKSLERLEKPVLNGNVVLTPFLLSATLLTSNSLDDVSKLTYSTYLGGSANEYANEITVDASGAAYVVGYTYSSNFPTALGAFQTSLKGTYDAYVTKLNPTGSGLVYSTYLGGDNNEIGSGVVVDTSGAVYISGSTSSSNFPTTSGAFQTAYGGSNGDAYVTKLNATGTGLVYSTFLGGNNVDGGNDIAVDTSGAAYITGYTFSSNFPMTSGAFQTTLKGSHDVFIAKLNATGTALGYSTLLGGSDPLGNDESGFAITLDTNGVVYVTGPTCSPDFPVTSGAFQTTINECNDVFVTKLDATGTALTYSTLLGGHDIDLVYDIAVDANGAAYVVGYTWASDFPVTPSAFQTTCSSCLANGNPDGFVTKLNASGTGLIYSTFLGGNHSEETTGIAVDASGVAYVAGMTTSTDFPTTSGAVQTACISCANLITDAFIAKLNANGNSLIYSTYLGGSSTDEIHAIDVDTTGAVFAAGQTSSSNFPTTSGVFDATFNGSSDAFVTKLAVGAFLPTQSLLNTCAPTGNKTGDGRG